MLSAQCTDERVIPGHPALFPSASPMRGPPACHRPGPKEKKKKKKKGVWGEKAPPPPYVHYTGFFVKQGQNIVAPSRC